MDPASLQKLALALPLSCLGMSCSSSESPLARATEEVRVAARVHHVALAQRAEGPLERFVHARIAEELGATRFVRTSDEALARELAFTAPIIEGGASCRSITEDASRTLTRGGGTKVVLRLDATCTSRTVPGTREEAYEYEVTEEKQRMVLVQEKETRTRPKICTRPETVCFPRQTPSGPACIFNVVSYVCGEETYSVDVPRERIVREIVRIPRSALRTVRTLTYASEMKGTISGPWGSRPVALRSERIDTSFETPHGARAFLGFTERSSELGLADAFATFLDETLAKAALASAEREYARKTEPAPRSPLRADDLLRIVFRAPEPRAEQELVRLYGLDRAALLTVLFPEVGTPR